MSREVLDAFLDEIHREFPRFVVIKKSERPLSKAIDVFLKIVTLGGMREFMTRYFTVIGDRLYVHADASAPGSWRYVQDILTAERSMAATDARVTFCGHVHRPQLYYMSRTKPPGMFLPRTKTPIPLVGKRKWLAVLGAVGQPRDQNPAAAYAIYDCARNELTYMRAGYDIEMAAAKIHAAGLPAMLAARLFIGR